MGNIDLNRARQLMNNQDFWDTVNAHDNSNGRHSVNHEGNMGGANQREMDVMNEMRQTMARGAMQPQRHSGMDKAILESFNEMPPIQYDGSAMSEIPDSFMEGLDGSTSRQCGIRQGRRTAPLPQQQRMPQQQMINEMVNYQQPMMQMPQPISSSAGIDYNYLKYLIGECVRESMTNMVNEQKGNSLYGIVLGDGNKIQLLDKKGNLYEAEMRLKKKKQ